MARNSDKIDNDDIIIDLDNQVANLKHEISRLRCCHRDADRYRYLEDLASEGKLEIFAHQAITSNIPSTLSEFIDRRITEEKSS